MDHNELTKVLELTRPGAKWALRGMDLEWLDNDTKAPSEDEINAGLKRVKSLQYKEKRAVAYPPIAEQLDALWKGGPDADAMRKTIQSVKTRHPKP